MEITKKDREEMCSELSQAYGWISCWIPLHVDLKNIDPDLVLDDVKAGVLAAALKSIENVKKRLGYVGGGQVES